MASGRFHGFLEAFDGFWKLLMPSGSFQWLLDAFNGFKKESTFLFFYLISQVI